ncbi:hypothetical protein [Polynucleobacter sp. CS-Odin-A6]|uniref:hypothetical protein n=1 Tax=Polynucleobacter sp. CS-Odin-A6 TaxID=2689106 RepID=UPI001C0BF381|nr:hypothetical protein [Polynucleobacter sp. CS-Odin-A6]MBU3621837.1 hypothetical protein [Polynucleobacter sp. CS-Odin-A6]
MNKYIVVTSIFPPTEAVKKFSENSNYKFIVVGDAKSPSDWRFQDVNYFSLVRQEALDFELVKKLPLNHYCRKMIGYLAAMSDAEIIVDTDDDNIPKDSWTFPDPNLRYRSLTGAGFINIYQ